MERKPTNNLPTEPSPTLVISLPAWYVGGEGAELTCRFARDMTAKDILRLVVAQRENARKVAADNNAKEEKQNDERTLRAPTTKNLRSPLGEAEMAWCQKDAVPQIPAGKDAGLMPHRLFLSKAGKGDERHSLPSIPLQPDRLLVSYPVEDMVGQGNQKKKQREANSLPRRASSSLACA